MDGKHSSWTHADSDSGVPQGTSRGPNLYLFHIMISTTCKTTCKLLPARQNNQISPRENKFPKGPR